MTVVIAKTLSRDDLEFLGSNVSREVLTERRRCRIIHYVPAKAVKGIRRQSDVRQRCNTFMAAEVK